MSTLSSANFTEGNTMLKQHTQTVNNKIKLLVIVWSSCRCSGTESVTALICSGSNRTEPDTGYSHLLACSSVTYRGWNAAHIHLPFDDVTYNIDQTLELTVMSIVCSIVILYAKYLAKMLHMVWCWNKKWSETGPKQCCSGRNSTSTGTRSSIISTNYVF